MLQGRGIYFIATLSLLKNFINTYNIVLMQAEAINCLTKIITFLLSLIVSVVHNNIFKLYLKLFEYCYKKSHYLTSAVNIIHDA